MSDSESTSETNNQNEIKKLLRKHIKKYNYNITNRKILILIIYSLSNIEDKRFLKKMINDMSFDLKLNVITFLNENTLDFKIDENIIEYIKLDITLFPEDDENSLDDTIFLSIKLFGCIFNFIKSHLFFFNK